MQSQGKIKAKLRDAKYRYLQRDLKKKLKCSPENCKYNAVHEVRPLQYVASEESPDTQVLRLCMYGSENVETWSGNICDTVDCAQSCPMYDPKFQYDELKAEFQTNMEDIDYLSEHHKDLAALVWVLEGDVKVGDYTPVQKASFVFWYYYFVLSNYIVRLGVS